MSRGWKIKSGQKRRATDAFILNELLLSQPITAYNLQVRYNKIHWYKSGRDTRLVHSRNPPDWRQIYYYVVPCLWKANNRNIN